MQKKIVGWYKEEEVYLKFYSFWHKLFSKHLNKIISKKINGNNIWLLFEILSRIENEKSENDSFYARVFTDLEIGKKI